MTRFDDPLFDPRLADWLKEDPYAAPDPALEVVLASLPSINQRRAVRAPWRNPNMTSTLRLGLAAAVVVAATLGGLYLLSSRTGPSVAAPETSPPAQSASPSAAASPPAANRTTFTSTQYRYSVEYPTPWAAVPATEAWTGEGQLGPEEPWVDRFFAPNSTTFVGIAALPRPDGQTDEEFTTGYKQRRRGTRPVAPSRRTPGPMQPSEMHRRSVPSSRAGISWRRADLARRRHRLRDQRRTGRRRPDGLDDHLR